MPQDHFTRGSLQRLSKHYDGNIFISWLMCSNFGVVQQYF